MRTNSIWKNREYLKLFASYTVGNIGDWFDIFALQVIFAHQLKASSYNQTIFQLCQVIGPLLGAGIITISSPYCCLGINAISFFVSALFLLMLKPIQETRVEIMKTNFVANLKDTWTIIKSNKILLNIFILATLMAIQTMMSYRQLVVLLNTIYPDNQTILGGIITSIAGIRLTFLLMGIIYFILTCYSTVWKKSHR